MIGSMETYEICLHTIYVLFDCDRDLLSVKAVCGPIDENILGNFQEELGKENS